MTIHWRAQQSVMPTIIDLIQHYENFTGRFVITNVPYILTLVCAIQRLVLSSIGGVCTACCADTSKSHTPYATGQLLARAS
jgi:hypothetical protein